MWVPINVNECQSCPEFEKYSRISKNVHEVHKTFFDFKNVQEFEKHIHAYKTNLLI